MAERQVFIIAEAELLVPQESSPEAANALLKLLEEPPPDTCFVLTSSEPGRLLDTIRSRSLPIHLSGLPRDEIASFLTDVGVADPQTARKASALAQGSIGRALGFLPEGANPGRLEELRQEALQLCRVALGGHRSDSFEAALGYSPTGARGLQDLLTFVEELLRDLAAAALGKADHLLNPDLKDLLEQAARDAEIHPLGVARAVDAVESARLLAAGNVNPQLIVSGMLRDLRLALAGPRIPSRSSHEHGPRIQSTNRAHTPGRRREGPHGGRFHQR
jgi:DNA polymerase-3 subunit delta'